MTTTSQNFRTSQYLIFQSLSKTVIPLEISPYTYLLRPVPCADNFYLYGVGLEKRGKIKGVYEVFYVGLSNISFSKGVMTFGPRERGWR